MPLRPVFWCLSLGIIIVLAGLITPSIGRVSAQARRTVDGANLRQLGQASIIYASEHDDALPVASDVWDYARVLAEDAGVDYPKMWLSMDDPASDTNADIPPTILRPGTSKPRELNPAFRQLKPSLSVVLGKLNTRMPATTPILWTRGLQPDGKWSPHSPYGDRGGYIMFLNGNMVFFKSLNEREGELLRFDGEGRTTNILEALPPGSRIGEYHPTDEEKIAWAKAVIKHQKTGVMNEYLPFIFLVLLWLPFVMISVYRLLKKSPGAFTVLLWPVILLILFAVIMPGCW